MTRHPILAGLCLALLCATAPMPGTSGAARAQSAGQNPADIDPAALVRAELIGGWQTASGSQMTALRLVLADGWKTYWRAPGEGGIPPRFDWAGSSNVGAVAFHWPRPEVFDVAGLRTIGYAGELVLPIEIVPADRDAPVRLAARVDLGVCHEICVPVSLDIGADLPRGATRPDAAIAAALADQPEAAASAGLAGANCALDPIRDGLRLTATLDIPSVGAGEFAVVELADQTVWVSQADFARTGLRAVAVADLVPPAARPFALSRQDIRITLFGGGRAVELDGCAG